MNTSITNNLGLIIFSIVLLVITFLLLPPLNESVRVQAIKECRNASRYEGTAPDGSRYQHELPDRYKQCLKDMRITN